MSIGLCCNEQVCGHCVSAMMYAQCGHTVSAMIYAQCGHTVSAYRALTHSLQQRLYIVQKQ
jgi:hypothetical protein